MTLNPFDCRVDPPLIPAEDLSGVFGSRLLELLGVQVRRNLVCLERDRREKGIDDERVIVTEIPYAGHFLGGCACAFATFARFGEGAESASVEKLGVPLERLEEIGADIVGAWVRAWVGGSREEVWKRFSSGRFLYLLGMGAWLLWHRLDAETRQGAAEVLITEADRFLGGPAPAQLYDDTQAESNAWTGGGLAAVSCVLRRHPHRGLWDGKAKEYMIGAYATVADVTSDRVVDGKRLRAWLSGANALADHTVENHGFVHPDYMAAIAEMLRCAAAYRLAGEPVPEAVAFNAELVFDRLMELSLPDGTHLYPQGTDYTARRVDSLFQAGALAFLRPDPRRRACLLRSLEMLEEMARAGEKMPMSGWIGLPYDLGTTWGLAQNYLMCRLFGGEIAAVADASLEEALAGVHVSEPGCFALRRTADAVSVCSWHDRTRPARIMGWTMPLDRDVLCYPLPWSGVGEVREAAGDGEEAFPAEVERVRHRVAEDRAGFSVVMELAWGGRKVRQHCAFIALPDGRSAYLEERVAVEAVAVAGASSGHLAIFDDERWPLQKGARRFAGARGLLDAEGADVSMSNWLSIDGRMGYVAVGADRFRVRRCAGQAAIWRGDGTMYDTCRVEFLPRGCAGGTARLAAGERISGFALISCPNQTTAVTAALAEEVGQAGFLVDAEGALVLELAPYVVYANFAETSRWCADSELPPFSGGWFRRDGRRG